MKTIDKKSKTVQISLILCFLFLPCLTGSWSKSGEDTDASLNALEMVARTLIQLEQNPCFKIDTRDAVYGSINGMFRTLDPYTQFLDETTFDYMEAQQKGSFYGIGVSFDIRDGELLVVSPIEDSPAYKLGIRAGDVIAEIEGKSTAGITTNDVITQLRGENGSKVKIGIRREGESELLSFEIKREKIDLDSARGGYLLDDKTGYVRLTEFSATTYDEMIEKMEHMSSMGMEQVILDLRFNGGGLLSAAEDISSAFLKKDQIIVSTRGRAAGNEMELKCKADGKFSDIPVIVLVNSSSASASEIVSGAIQDHDRGLVIGTETHGKGLVGSQYRTKLGTAAQITTAQYFTPSGRFIQRPFDIPHRDHSGTISATSDSSKSRFKTDRGRVMYGQGGITPDVIVEEPILSNEMYRLESRRNFFDFAVIKGEDYGIISLDFVVTDQILTDFYQFLEDKQISIDINNLKTQEHAVKTGIRREMLAVYLDSDIADKVRVMELETVKKALELFPVINEKLNQIDSASSSSADDS